MKRYLKLTLYCLLGAALASSCNKGTQQAKETEAATAATNDTDAALVSNDNGSVYASSTKWTDQNGRPFTLKDLQGKIPVVSMVFTGCTFSCPRTVEDLKIIERQVPAAKKKDVVFVLISFDSEKDKPEVLKHFAEERSLGSNWILLHGDEADVREASMLLDVKYEKEPNGMFAHSNLITLLNRKGSIVARLEGLQQNPEGLVKTIGAL